MEYRLSAQAQQDLLAIYVQGAERFGPDQADRYAERFIDAFERLVDFPEMARPRREYGGRRILRVGIHIVVYRIEADTIFVIRVRHGREDWRSDEDDIDVEP